MAANRAIISAVLFERYSPPTCSTASGPSAMAHAPTNPYVLPGNSAKTAKAEAAAAGCEPLSLAPDALNDPSV
eukprot:10899586-Alexandrium_andersonii.AAC.1